MVHWSSTEISKKEINLNQVCVIISETVLLGRVQSKTLLKIEKIETRLILISPVE